MAGLILNEMARELNVARQSGSGPTSGRFAIG